LKSIIDRFSEVLPDVPLGRLHGRMTKEKLNLLEFFSGTMTEAGAGATKIVGRETVNADSLGILFQCIPDYVACNSCKYGSDLRHPHQLIEWWYELAANACRLIIRDLVNLPENQDRVRDGNFSFLKTNATFDRAMEIGRKRNKWKHHRLS
jgi:hypothetical protein